MQTDLIERNAPDAPSIIQWAEAAAKNQDWIAAAKRWALLRELYPNHAPGWVQGAVAERELKQYPESQALLQQARERFPNNPNVLLHWAELYLAQQDWRAALDKLQQLQQAFPEEVAGYTRLVDVLVQQGKLAEAEGLNALVRDRFPDRPRVWKQHAELAMEQQQWQSALERWELMRNRFPKRAEGYVRAAEAARNLGNDALARKLQLAQEYGNAWLETILEEDEEKEGEHSITPPERRNWRTFADLVWTKARLNLKSEASKNHLRYIWWILDPILYMTVFYLVFGVLMERGGPGFIAYLLTGLVPFQWFSKTIQQTSGSIVGGKGLMHKVRISPLFFPLVGVVQNTGKQLLVFAMLALFLAFYGLPPTIHWLAFIPIVMTQLLLMVVVSCLVAMVIPFIRDLSNLVPTGLQFLLFTSGIFYSVERIPAEWRTLFFSNPMANILFQYRQIFVENEWPIWSMLGWVALGSLLGLGTVLWLYRRLEPVFPRVALE